MKRYNALIVDDESLARQVIRKYSEHSDDIEIVGECNDGFECLKFLSEHPVDILFLDIQMPKINGFEMLELLSEKPKIIFTTAFDQYAIKAFEMNAVDYLLKPFSKERFFEALDKCIARLGLQKNSDEKLDKLAEYPPEVLERIVVRNGNKVVIIPVQEILYLESAENYVSIHARSGNYLKEKTMKFFEQYLPKLDFIRLHRSYIVNLSAIITIEPYTRDSYVATLKNGEKIKVSQEGYKNFRAKMV
jgi:two-component system LytT family response regulator